MLFLEPTVNLSSNFASLFSVMRHNASVLLCFEQTNPIKLQVFGLSTAYMKINQILYVIFQATSQFSFKLCNTLQCHDTRFLWNFVTETVYALDKKSPPMYNFQTFGCSNESLPNSSCHFWNYIGRDYWNFASLFSVMKDNSSVFF